MANDAPVDKWIQKFLSHLATDRGASIYTQRNYKQALTEFARWHLEERKSPLVWEKLQRDEFRGLVRFLGRNNLSRAATQLRFSALRTFYKFLIRHGAAESSPIKNLSLPKLEKRLPKFLTKQQMEALLIAPFELLKIQKTKKAGRPVSQIAALRDVAVLETIYSCGLRVSELCGLRVDDIDWSEQIVRVRGKGKKERLVPIGRPALMAIQDYWNTFKQPPGGRGAGFLAETKKRAPLGPVPACAAVETIPRHRRTGSRLDAAQAAAQLRDASAGCGRGFAERAGTARPRASRHDAGLHARHDGAVEKGLRRGASAGLIGQPKKLKWVLTRKSSSNSLWGVAGS